MSTDPDVSYGDAPAEPVVSIVIVNWNSRQLLEQCLQSLYETTKIDIETIVVDNGSHDESIKYLRSDWPQVTSISLEQNHGFAGANNIGFQYCRGRYILLLNVDTIAQPTMVSGLVECMEEYPEAGCVGARHLNPDGSLQWSMDDFPSILNDTLRYSDLIRLPILQSWLRRTYPAFSDHDVDREVGWVNGACFMIRREILHDTGGLDEYFFIYAEELDWCARIWKAGWTVRFTPRAEVIHLHGGSFSATDGKRTILLYQSLRRYYRKHYCLPRYWAISAMVGVNAAARIAGVAAMHTASALGREPSQELWELITQQHAKSTWKVMYQTWWRTMWVTPGDPVRP